MAGVGGEGTGGGGGRGGKRGLAKRGVVGPVRYCQQIFKEFRRNVLRLHSHACFNQLLQTTQDRRKNAQVRRVCVRFL